MKHFKQTVGAAVITVALVLVTGCDTPVGRGLGSMININGQNANDFFKGVMAQMNPQQQAQLQAQSPQTLQTLQHNDQVAQQQQQTAAAPQAPAPGQTAQAGQPAAPAPAADAPIPLKVDDIKAMTSAGLKPQSIIDAIKESKSTYTSDDIDAAQKATPPVDASVIAFMKNPAA